MTIFLYVKISQKKRGCLKRAGSYNGHFGKLLRHPRPAKPRLSNLKRGIFRFFAPLPVFIS